MTKKIYIKTISKSQKKIKSLNKWGEIPKEYIHFRKYLFVLKSINKTWHTWPFLIPLCTALKCTALHAPSQPCNALHYTAMHINILHFPTVHSTALATLSCLQCILASVSGGQCQWPGLLSFLQDQDAIPQPPSTYSSNPNNSALDH